MADIARELGTSVSRVALAWVRGRPGVASTIIGARTLEQLEDNLGSLEVELTIEHRRRLDDMTRPELSFPRVSWRMPACSTKAEPPSTVAPRRSGPCRPPAMPIGIDELTRRRRASQWTRS